MEGTPRQSTPCQSTAWSAAEAETLLKRNPSETKPSGGSLSHGQTSRYHRRKDGTSVFCPPGEERRDGEEVNECPLSSSRHQQRLLEALENLETKPCFLETKPELSRPAVSQTELQA